MRKQVKRATHGSIVKRRLAVSAAMIIALLLWFSYYVNTTVKPTLHELAEYEARAAAVKAINSAVAAELLRDPHLCDGLYYMTSDGASINTAAANAVQSCLTNAAQNAMQALPQIVYTVPFGSLTNNTLLSGAGPGWEISLKPQGYVQGKICEVTQTLSINTTRYSAVLQLCVTINMILDGKTSTITVEQTVPLCTVLLSGEVPAAYMADFD